MKIAIKNLQKRIPITPKQVRAIKKAIHDSCAAAGSRRVAEVSVCILDDAPIRELNLNYLAHDEPTDVLAFDLSQRGEGIRAEIAVSAETAQRNARAFKTLPGGELLLYVVHGMLHVLGYDDSTSAGRRRMQAKAERILRRIPWPY